MVNAETKRFGIEVLREFSAHVFLYFGFPKEDGEQAADVLACADLDSHGVARLHSYFEMLSIGRINPKPRIEMVRSTLSTATVDPLDQDSPSAEDLGGNTPSNATQASRLPRSYGKMRLMLGADST